jgi:hypothetical protein
LITLELERHNDAPRAVHRRMNTLPRVVPLKPLDKIRSQSDVIPRGINVALEYVYDPLIDADLCDFLRQSSHACASRRFRSPKHLASWIAWQRRERGRELQPSSHQRQPPDAARPQSGRKRGREGQGHHLRDRVSTTRPASRTRASHRGYHPPPLPTDLEDSSPGVRYEERGPAVSAEAKKVRARKMIRELRSLGYRVELPAAPSSSPA